MTVNRLIPPIIDTHHLAIYDDNILDLQSNLIDRVRDSTQYFVNNIWSNTEHEKLENEIFSVLPITEQNIILPREKPIPLAKKKTKWELFAQQKGIKKKKHARLVYDEDTKQYIPKWGYKSKRNQKDREWAIEIPNNINPNTDMFELRKNKKNEKVAKNEFQRLRNIARNNKKKADPSKLGLNPVSGGDKTDLIKSFNFAKKSTASLGKFDNKVHNEDKQIEKNKKRKFYENCSKNINIERERFLDIAKDIEKGKSILNVKKAAGRLNAGEQGEAGKGKKREKIRLNEEKNKIKGKIGMRAKAKKAQRAGKKGKK